MKKINNLLLALLSVFALAWTACDDEVEYTPAGLLDGNGVYFPTSTQTSYEVEGTSGTLTFDVMRTLTTEAQEATLNITYGEGAESVFSIPASVNFAAGDTLATLTVQYDNLVQGTTYTAELSFADGTPYAYSTINLSVVYPNKIEYEWEKVSENVLQAVRDHRCVRREERKTHLDMWVSYLAFIFDLNFPSSFRFIQGHDYINRCIDRMDYHGQSTREAMEEVRRICLDYVQEKAEV